MLAFAEFAYRVVKVNFTPNIESHKENLATCRNANNITSYIGKMAILIYANYEGQVSLRIRAVSSRPSLPAYGSYEYCKYIDEEK